MNESDVARALAAATSIVRELGLEVDRATVLHNSNKLALRLSPSDVFARVAHRGQEVAEFEVELARQLAGLGSPLAALDPRVEPRPHELDGFVVTLWTFHESIEQHRIAPDDYAGALARLHDGMRRLDLTTPHFTDRVEEAQQLVADHASTPALSGDDRELLSGALRYLRRTIVERGSAEQILHGEPHPGNVLDTATGVRFVDLETCCRGPVEFDLAHVPEAVSDCYPNVDAVLLDDCRGIVIAMVAAWRWDRTDQFPDGRRSGEQLVRVLRRGPPWRGLDAVMDT